MRESHLRALRRRLFEAARAMPMPWDRVAARERRKARLADELLATLEPMTLFDAGYAADRLVRSRHQHRRTLHIRQRG
jgi:hypothetical protein